MSILLGVRDLQRLRFVRQYWRVFVQHRLRRRQLLNLRNQLLQLPILRVLPTLADVQRTRHLPLDGRVFMQRRLGERRKRTTVRAMRNELLPDHAESLDLHILYRLDL